MSTPQQPELARSHRSRVTPMPPDERMQDVDTGGEAGPVPPGNRPGRKPRKQQDKPVGPPPTPLPRLAKERRFGFAFDPIMVPAAAGAGVTPWTAWLDLGHEEISIRFGPWSMRFPRASVTGAEVTGPYKLIKVVGPPHLSLADRGVTFATNRRAGVCIHLDEPVPGIEPTGRLRHPAVTVTVDDPEELVTLLGS